ncbi:MAG: hypothetical protein ABI867_06540 [Kofleriaceae bacterium]
MRWSALALLAGCYAPIVPAGAPCADGQLCPSGLTCTATPDGDRCLDEPFDPPIDGPVPPLPPDAPGGCVPTVLLAAGTDPVAQGWVFDRVGTADQTVTNQFLELRTSNNGRQMMSKANAVPLDRFIIEMVVQVVASGGHTDSDAAIALMGSFHPPTGNAADLTRMIALDTDAMGFQGASIGVTTTTMQTYRLERTETGGFKVSIPNGGSISVGSFTTNGTIAIGDQTTAPGLDSTIRIASIKRLCP